MGPTARTGVFRTIGSGGSDSKTSASHAGQSTRRREEQPEYPAIK